MDASIWAAGGFVINVLLGGVMWFIKDNYKELKQANKDLRVEMDSIKEHYYRKEDFREFRDELWRRLDRMEQHWQDKLNELRE